jgi:hypothetical protein
MPEMCHVSAEGIEFNTTEAASREKIGIVRKWVDLANTHVSRIETETERESLTTQRA